MISNLLSACSIALFSSVLAVGNIKTEIKPNRLGQPGDFACVYGTDFLDQPVNCAYYDTYTYVDIQGNQSNRNLTFTTKNVYLNSSSGSFEGDLFAQISITPLFIPTSIPDNTGQWTYNIDYYLYNYEVLNFDRSKYVSFNALDFDIRPNRVEGHPSRVVLDNGLSYTSSIGENSFIISALPYVFRVNTGIDSTYELLHGSISVFYEGLSYDDAPLLEVGLKVYADYGIENTFNQGYQIGYSVGNGNGYIDGYEDGSIEGHLLGWQEGYSTALSTLGENHTFMSLFNSIADTPLRFLYGLFNFDLFGTSVLVIILSLLTGIVVFAIIKRVWK